MKIIKMLIFAILLWALPASATHFFLNTAANGGSDSNNGLSAGAPFLTLNHSFNCATDDVTAAGGTYTSPVVYTASNFQGGGFGTNTCAAGHGFVPVICGTFLGCYDQGTNTNAMKIGSSYWAIIGWHLSTTGTVGSCIAVQSTSGVIHDLLFANNFLDGCISSGITTANTGTTASEDYVYAIGNAIWNAAQSTQFCDSGITFYQLIQLDSAPGTHILAEGNFLIDNVAGFHCNANSTTFDGEGIAFDSLDFGQGGGTPYLPQVVARNNYALFNGGYGIATTGSGSTAKLYIHHNTLVGNMKANPTDFTTVGDLVLFAFPGVVQNAEVAFNLVKTGAATGGQGGAHPLYAGLILNGDGSDHMYADWFYSAAGNNTQATTSAGFSFGPSNVTGSDPNLPSPVDPGEPNCTGATSIPNCMAGVIAAMTPANAAAKAYGAQPVDNALVQTFDPIYPQVLCNANVIPLITGLITQHCVPAGVFQTSVEPPTLLVARAN